MLNSFLGPLGLILAFLALQSFATPGIPEKDAKPAKQGDEIQCTAGYCSVTGTLHADPVLSGRYFKLVETSTPTAQPNTALIWLQQEGSSSTLKVIFENGTIKTLLSN